MKFSIAGQTVGYIRVSSVDQNTGRQDELLQGYKLDVVFKDKCSGKDILRPQLQAALKHLRNGDTLVVASFDRLARNLDDLRKIVTELAGKGVIVKFIKENITFTGEDNPMSILLLSIMGAFAEFERALLRERQREGIEIAKKTGKYKGRKPILSQDKVKELIKSDIDNKHKNRAALARKMGISRETLYQYIRTNENAISNNIIDKKKQTENENVINRKLENSEKNTKRKILVVESPQLSLL